MTFFDYAELLKLNANIEDCNLTLPECNEFAAFIWEISCNHISDDNKLKLKRRYSDYERAADAYKRYMDSLTLDQLNNTEPNAEAVEAAELWWRVCDAVEEMAYFIRFQCGNKQYFEVEGE